MFVKSFIVVLICLILFGCGDEASQNPSKNNKVKNDPAKEKARLTKIVSDFWNARPEWKVKLVQREAGYTWNGQTFSFIDGLSPNKADYFHNKISVDGPERSYFNLLHLLLSQKHFDLFSSLISSQKKEQKSKTGVLAFEYCFAWGWTFLERSEWKDGEKLFKIMTDQQLNNEKLKREAAGGLLLAEILHAPEKVKQVKKITFVKNWRYCMANKEVDFFRASSPIASMAEKLLSQKPSDYSSLIITDMVFSLGARAKNRSYIWQKGIEIIENIEIKPENKEPASLLRHRFSHALAWNHIVEGKLEKGQSFFEKILESDLTKQQELDAGLGLAVTGFLKEPVLEEINAGYSAVLWPEYWLAGRKFTFYRTPGREKRREIIEQICKEVPAMRDYLVLLDAYCLLGDSRAARTLLSLIVEQYGSEIDLDSLGVEQDIPKDKYAELQVWEMLE